MLLGGREIGKSISERFRGRMFAKAGLQWSNSSLLLDEVFPFGQDSADKLRDELAVSPWFHPPFRQNQRLNARSSHITPVSRVPLKILRTRTSLRPPGTT